MIDRLSQTNFNQVMQSHWCKLVFLLSLFLAYWLIPTDALQGPYQLLVLVFMIGFAASLTCTIQAIKDSFKSHRVKEASFVSLVAGLLGLAAVQFCSINAVLCGSTIGVALLSAVLPSALFQLIHFNAVWLLLISIIAQLISLWHLGCFRSSQKNCDQSKKT
ncbi:MAG: hypothetical protein GF381_01980 [Candidatus Pacebacteria bacterium]|nr:hypothetical protein [Candidatus Paceibacterota bacterium]